MPDITPVTRSDLLRSVTQSLTAQQKLREVMAGVAAEVAASKALAPPAPPAK